MTGVRTTREDVDARASIRQYARRLTPQARASLRALERAVWAAIPRGEPAFSYSIPAVRVGGRVALWYAAWKNHVSLYPIGDSIRRPFARELAGFETSKGTLRFPLDRPIPKGLVARIVRAKLAETTGLKPRSRGRVRPRSRT